MADEYKEHLQCQTCYVHFESNTQLLNHVEEYRSRERLLLAELERCRMHLAKPENVDGGKEFHDSSPKEEGEEDEPESSQSDSLKCPFNPCRQGGPYSHRGNLVRHFQAHVDCYEMCPMCHEHFGKVHRYLRHGCKSTHDDPRGIFIERRTTHFNATVSKELDQWKDRPRAGSKRDRTDSVSEQVQKRIKDAPISALGADECCNPSSQLGDSTAMAMNDQLENPACERFTASCTTDQVFDEKTTTVDLNDGNPLYLPGSIYSEWPFSDAAMNAATVNEYTLGDWAFADATMGATTNNEWTLGEWAFADSTTGATTNNEWVLGEWAFAGTFASATSGND